MGRHLEDRFLFLTTGKTLSTTRAREVLIREGHAMPSVATLNRVRRGYGLTKRELGQDMRAGVRFEAKHPNQLWQIDSTGSSMFFQDMDGSVLYESPLKRTRNRSTQRRPHIWFIAVVDDYSRALWAQIVPANDTHAWLGAFGNAAREKGSEFPLCGLPDEIYVDNDSVVRSVRFTRIMEMFDPPVKIRKALPYIGKRSKGKVERAIRTIKDGFEAEHRAAEVPHLARVIDQSHHQPTKWRSLEEANEHLYTWLLEYNNRSHSSTGEAPFRRWVNGTYAKRPRVVSEQMLKGYMLMDSRQSVIQRDLCVVVNRVRYALPRTEPFVSMVRQRVTIWCSPEYAGCVFADVDGASYEIHPSSGPLAWGEFRAIPHSTREKIKLEIAKSDDVPVEIRAPEDVPADAPRYAVGRPSVAAVPDALPAREVMRNRVQALIWLTEREYFRTPVCEDERAALDELFAGRDVVSLDELAQWADFWTRARDVDVA